MTPTPRIECTAVRVSHHAKRVANEHTDLGPIPHRDDDASIERAAFFGPGDDIRGAMRRARDVRRAKELRERHKRALAINDLKALRDILDELLEDNAT